MKFKPLKGIYPSDDIAESVLIQNVSTYTKSKLKQIIELNDQAFLNVIEPTQTQEKNKKNNFTQVRTNLNSFIEGDVLSKGKNSFYIYKQYLNEYTTFEGVIGALHLDAFKKGKILELEKTIPGRVDLFTEYLSDVNFQADPVVFTYSEKKRVGLLLDVEMKKKPYFSFTSSDQVKHEFWIIESPLVIKQIRESIESLNHLYLLDGHHRFRSSLNYRENRKSKDKEYLGTEEYNYLLSFLIDDTKVKIQAYQRLVKDIGKHTKESFLAEMQKCCKVVEKKTEPYYPSDKHYACMYLDGDYYMIFFGNTIEKGLDKIDTFFLEENILKTILNLNPTTKEGKSRLDYLPGSLDQSDLQEVKAKVDIGEYKVGFVLYPTPLDDLVSEVSDANNILPAKSFYILPRLLSGLTIMDTE